MKYIAKFLIFSLSEIEMAYNENTQANKMLIFSKEAEKPVININLIV